MRSKGHTLFPVPRGGRHAPGPRRGQALAGFTLIELLTVMAIISLLIALLLPALTSARRVAKLNKEGSRIKQIHTAWVTWSGEFDGSLPRPGLVDRRPDPVTGTDVPGRGPEDNLANDHAALFSVSIMREFFSPQMCVGVTEVSARVFVRDAYSYHHYEPGFDFYWDHAFSADLQDESNVSYGVLPVCGARKSRLWRADSDSTVPIIGNRGPRGDDDLRAHIDNMADSITIQLHGGRKEWVGQVCYADNHTEVTRTFLPESVWYRPPGSTATLPDNLFNDDTGNDDCSGYDAWLTVVDELTGDQTTQSPVVSWD